MLERLRNNLGLKVLALAPRGRRVGLLPFRRQPCDRRALRSTVERADRRDGPRDRRDRALRRQAGDRDDRLAARRDDAGSTRRSAGGVEPGGPRAGVYSVGGHRDRAATSRSSRYRRPRRRCRSSDRRRARFRSPSGTPAMRTVWSRRRCGLNPSAATVRGASSDLARVANVRVDVAVPGTRAERVDGMVRPVAVDARGDEVAERRGITEPRPRTRANFRHARGRT